MDTTDTQLTISLPATVFPHMAFIAIAAGVAFLTFPWLNQIMLFMRIAAMIVMSNR